MLLTNRHSLRLTACSQPSPGLKPVRYEYSPNLPGILQHLNSSLAITTYQAGKLAVVGVQDDRLKFSFHHLEQAMGVAVGPDAVAVGSRRSIHVLKAAHDIGPGIQPAGTFDSAWLTRQSFRTGNIHGHELGWGREGMKDEGGRMNGPAQDDSSFTRPPSPFQTLWVVNTLFSTLCTLDENYSFVPRWRPPFISELSANDRCHLNGMAMHDGRPKYVTAHGDSDEPGGWRDGKATGGVVIDVDSGETVARGFAMPHSPRLEHGRLWVLNSGAGQLGTIDVDSGTFTPVETFPGYARGLSFHGQFAFVGLSKIRETSVFGGMPLEKDRANLRCGVAVVDLVSGKTVATLQFHSGVDEIFAVSVLPGCQRPCVVGPNDDEDERADIWVVPSAAAVPGQATDLPAIPSVADDDPTARVDRLVRLAEELQGQGRLQESRQAYEQALTADPHRATMHCNLGNLWQQLDDQHRAIACYERAVEIDETCVPARQNLGYLLFNHGRTDEAVAQYDRLVALDPSPINRLLAAGVLPVVYESSDDVALWRQRMLDRLDAMIADGMTIDTEHPLVPTSFFPAYQGGNDVEIVQRLSRICTGPELVAEADGKLQPRSDGRLRIGFLSAYFHDHTIGRLNLGRIRDLDREKFEVTVLSASARNDDAAAEFRAAADRHCMLPRNVADARRTIADQDLDVLIFADVGMDALTTTLSWSRMAPVQCVTWGHPDTTGSPHMDYFLSSDLLETDEADDHYTEKLVRLPLLATYFERPQNPVLLPPGGEGGRSPDEGAVSCCRHSPSGRVGREAAGEGPALPEPAARPSQRGGEALTAQQLNRPATSGGEVVPDGPAQPLSREDRHATARGFGLSETSHHYVCPQTLFKFHPDFDAILADILTADPDAEIVLLEGRVGEWTDRLKRRFERTLPGGCEWVTFLPAMPRDDFLRLLSCADVVIDPPHFGGGHTSYETFAMGTPLVTLPGPFLRSRITQAQYRRMGMTDLIVDGPEQFVATAVRLGTDESFRTACSRRILAACPILFERAEEVRCLESWLWSLTDRNGARAEHTLAGSTQ